MASSKTRLRDVVIAWFIYRQSSGTNAPNDGIDPLETLKLARDREKMERDERRALEQRATTMLSVTVALAALGIAGLRQLAKQHGKEASVFVWASGPRLYVVITVVLLLRALTVPPPE